MNENEEIKPATSKTHVLACRVERIVICLMARNRCNGFGSVMLCLLFIGSVVLFFNMRPIEAFICLSLSLDAFLYVGSEQDEKNKVSTLLPFGGLITFYRSFLGR